MYAGVIIIDGNRIRFRMEDWRSMLALKHLRLNIRGIIAQSLRSPGRRLSEQQQVWFDIWKRAFEHRATEKEKVIKA